MTDEIKSEVMSRRRALSLLGLAALSLAVPTVFTVSDATVSDAEAQAAAPSAAGSQTAQATPPAAPAARNSGASAGCSRGCESQRSCLPNIATRWPMSANVSYQVPRFSTAVSRGQSAWSCAACKVDYPDLNGIPFLLTEPTAALAEWQGRLRLLLQSTDADAERPMDGTVRLRHATLERDDISSNRHPSLPPFLSMIFSENRYPLFGIMR